MYLILSNKCNYWVWFNTHYLVWLRYYCRFQAAENDCNLCLSIDPTYVKAYLRRGTARKNLKKFSFAKDDFLKVLELEPENKQAQAELKKLTEVFLNLLYYFIITTGFLHSGNTWKVSELKKSGKYLNVWRGQENFYFLLSNKISVIVVITALVMHCFPVKHCFVTSCIVKNKVPYRHSREKCNEPIVRRQ